MAEHISLNKVPRDVYILDKKELADVIMDKTRISGEAVFDIAQTCPEHMREIINKKNLFFNNDHCLYSKHLRATRIA